MWHFCHHDRVIIYHFIYNANIGRLVRKNGVLHGKPQCSNLLCTSNFAFRIFFTHQAYTAALNSLFDMASAGYFRLDRFLAQVGVLQGLYDGHRIVPDRRSLLTFRVAFVCMLWMAVRFTANLLFPRQHPAQFFLHDMQWFFSDRSHLLMHTVDAWIANWVLVNFVVYAQMNRKPCYAYWLRFFISFKDRAEPSSPDTKVLSSCCSVCRSRQLDTTDSSDGLQFQRFSNVVDGNARYFSHYFVPVWFLAIGAMNIPYLYTPTPFLMAWLVWIVMVVNTAYVFYILLLFIVVGPMLSHCQALLCQLFIIRFQQTNRQFGRILSVAKQCCLPKAQSSLVNVPLSGAKLQPTAKNDTISSLTSSKSLFPEKTNGSFDQFKHLCISLTRLQSVMNRFDYATIDVQRMNKFWRIPFLVNYLFAIMIVIFSVVSLIVSPSFAVNVVLALMLIAVYTIGIILPILYIGKLTFVVRTVLFLGVFFS